MVLVIGFLVFTHFCAFMIGWGMKSDIRNGVGHRTDADRIINEMRLQRANNYFNDPVVNEMRKEHNDRN